VTLPSAHRIACYGCAMRPVSALVLLALCACQPAPTVDPSQLEKVVQSLEKAAAATAEAIDAARDAAVIPEEPEVDAVPAPAPNE
jgi:hypothetical protein